MTMNDATVTVSETKANRFWVFGSVVRLNSLDM